MTKEIKLKILNLIKKIRKLEYKYFILNKNLVTDYEYDLLLEQLKLLETKYPKFKFKNSPTEKLHNFISEELNKKKHLIPMLSLKTIYSINELYKFNDNILKQIGNNNINYCCETKLDGLAVNLLYKNGELNRASTRGNGIYGEDISHNIKNINGIPLKLNDNILYPYIIEIRGEICISYKDFFYLNNLNKINNKKQFSTPRNTVSGLVRQKKYNIMNNLDFFSYGIGKFFNNKKEFILPDNHFELLKLINKLGFNIKNNIKICNNINDIINFHTKIKTKRKNIKYSIDGIVVKLNSIYLQNKIGVSNKYPNWSIAYKFSPEEKITEIKDIEYQIGRTGVLTPIAKVNPIYMSGVLIKNISLINIKKIKDLNLSIDDTVLIKKSGDIIPVVKKVISKKINKKNYLNIPNKCPFCKSEVININNKIIKCISDYKCESQIKLRILHFFSKDAIFIKGLGLNLINKIDKYKKLNNPIDLFELFENNFIDLAKFNKNNKNILNLKDIINSKIKIKLENFIYALGIEGIGKFNSIELSKNYKNIFLLKNEDINKLKKIKGIGNKAAISIFTFFNNKNNIEMINKLLNKYIKIY